MLLLHVVAVATAFTLPNFATLPKKDTLAFPKWLSDFTGLYEWPGLDPPYIPLDFMDFRKAPFSSDAWIHKQGDCNPMYNNDQVCSFDCFNCAAGDDVYTCPVLSQTFDDGPSPYTPKLLKSLKLKTTFFTIGVNVVKHPEIYRNAALQGHIMGCHTWSHKFLPSLSNEQIVAQIQWSIWAMNATYGHIPKWFRPPYGGIDNRVRSILRQFGMQAVLWDFDTMDWKIHTDMRLQPEMLHRVDEFSRQRGNTGLILEHDSLQNTVELAISLHKQLKHTQMTVPQCVGGIDYIKVYAK